MKKLLKSHVLIYILCTIILGGIANVAASTIFANSINYKNGTVEDALNDLYDKTTNYKKMMLLQSNVELKSGSYELDCTNLDNYQSLTSDNFIYVYKKMEVSASKSVNISSTPYKTYNSTTGKLTYGRPSAGDGITPIAYVDIYVVYN